MARSSSHPVDGPAAQSATRATAGPWPGRPRGARTVVARILTSGMAASGVVASGLVAPRVAVPQVAAALVVAGLVAAGCAAAGGRAAAVVRSHARRAAAASASALGLPPGRAARPLAAAVGPRADASAEAPAGAMPRRLRSPHARPSASPAAIPRPAVAPGPMARFRTVPIWRVATVRLTGEDVAGRGRLGSFRPVAVLCAPGSWEVYPPDFTQIVR